MSEPTPTIDPATTVDENRYGPGPWVGEPDRIEWRYRGVPCLMVRNVELGNWCGYAAVPPGHPWHGRDMEAIDVEVHWGLTYSAACTGQICHAPQPGEPADVWWLGFDCGHGFDIMPWMSKRLGARRLDSSFPADGPFAVKYRDVAYVRAECERLADQILAAAR